ncbi:MAG: SDR family oxidoreductase [Bacteroidota bacterium]
MHHKVVLITGGSSGIGRAIGIYLTQKGLTVYGTTRNKTKHPDFSDFHLLELDVREPKTITTAIDLVIEKEGRLDVLINNAGVGITGPVEETPKTEIDNVFEINFHGPVRMINAVLPQMRKQNGGLIINITSIAGFMGLPYRGYYSASKGALSILTEALRMEVKSFGVAITNIAPGDFATNIAAGRYHAPVLDNSPYKTSYAHSLATIDEHVDDGEDPKDVAEQVYKILQKAHPKVHVPVGTFLQKFSLRLKKILPDKVYEKLLLNHYKL